ncbi:MAG: hypothetical protein KCHDKBKB_01398 [Elusimicrobia bacterium]|nr:hypothetical protein [Elusimicrobiota bacterium]
MAVKSTWFDLLTSNMADTRSFYEGLFGWQFLRLSDSALPDYWVIQAGEELIGGLRKASAETQSQNSSVLYFTVPNLESSAQRVKELGGQLVGERVDLGKNRGSYQWFRDREGNMAALWAAQKESI